MTTNPKMDEAGPYPAEVRIAQEWGLHPEEANPRAETFLHERTNWAAEVAALRVQNQRLRVENAGLREELRLLGLRHTDACKELKGDTEG